MSAHLPLFSPLANPSLFPLVRRPFSGPQLAGVIKPRLLIKPATQAIQWQSKQTSWVRDKMRPPSRSRSFVPWFKHSTLATSRDTYQEGRNNAGLPGHDVSWTGHYTTEQNSLSNNTQPCSYTCASRHNTPCISDCRQHHWGRPSDIYQSWLLSHAQLLNSLYTRSRSINIVIVGVL